MHTKSVRWMSVKAQLERRSVEGRMLTQHLGNVVIVSYN
jgi:hypothetical protein